MHESEQQSAGEGHSDRRGRERGGRSMPTSSNEAKVDCFMRRHGVKVKTPTAGFETMSVEDLNWATKESIEDLIAEKELQEQSVTVDAAEVAAAKPVDAAEA